MAIMLTMSNPNLDVVPPSCAEGGGAEWALVRADIGTRLAVMAPPAAVGVLDHVEGEITVQDGRTLCLGPLSSRNAAALRRYLPWLAPRPIGLRTSAGMGDRLGLATPGHVRAVRAVGGTIVPIFAQQSIREMTRTGRTPRQVLDDATWGVFAEGWRGGFGADADHLKTTEDIDACLAAGFTFFTIDPGEHVDGAADTLPADALAVRFDAMPWALLEDSAAAVRARYAGRAFDIDGRSVRLDEPHLTRAVVKYGRAVAHVAAMYRHLAARAGDHGFELEVSVDETETPTSPAEHVYVASELRRLGVRWVSLAPRFVGRFEKGVDYIGDLGAFEADFAIHAGIARAFGPYKLSLHSGSDKFSIYPIAARQTRGLVHLKTAGTSYLEALRTLAMVDPGLFRAIYAFSRERYEDDRASYHVSAELARAADPEALADVELPMLLDQFDAREILHVTYGSVLTSRGADGRLRFGDRLVDGVRTHGESYARCVEAHFVEHLRPFARA
jgi:hypothetical protein